VLESVGADLTQLS